MSLLWETLYWEDWPHELNVCSSYFQCKLHLVLIFDCVLRMWSYVLVYWCPNKMDTIWQSLVCWVLCFIKLWGTGFQETYYLPISYICGSIYVLLRNKVLFFYSPLLGLPHKHCVSGRQVWESLLCSVVIPQILLILQLVLFRSVQEIIIKMPEEVNVMWLVILNLI